MWPFLSLGAMPCALTEKNSFGSQPWLPGKAGGNSSTKRYLVAAEAEAGIRRRLPLRTSAKAARARAACPANAGRRRSPTATPPVSCLTQILLSVRSLASSPEGSGGRPRLRFPHLPPPKRCLPPRTCGASRAVLMRTPLDRYVKSGNLPSHRHGGVFGFLARKLDFYKSGLLRLYT